MDIESLLPFVKRPSRYIGNEFNAVKKDWQAAALRLVLVFPDLYEIGMSHHGLQILYRIVNSRPDLLAERSYVPDIDFEQLLRKTGQPVFSLESRRPLADFDLIGITLPYELCYTNILTLLDLAGLPFRATDRDDSQPLVIGGGSSCFNPEPVADFFDAILLGDGEEAILELADAVKEAKAAGLDRAATLCRLSEIKGVYVPSLFRPEYDADGVLLEVKPLLAGYEKVDRRILPDMASSPVPYPPVVPLTKIVHDRLGLEIARGCTRGCRFCQAGIIYRPVRERSVAAIEQAAMAGIEASGFDELALLSLSTGDYACLPGLLKRLMDAVSGSYVSVSMPSMRVGTLTRDIMDQIKRVRKTGFTVAPEAGCDRLRRVINKGITEEDLLETCRVAFSLGWKLIKFYFMFGLPTETMEDVEAIPELARRALNTAGGGGCKINVSAATFVPKPHTPFQWERQISVAEGFERIDLLKKNLPRKGFRLKWHDPRQSFMEGVMSRGDRRLARLIEEAWQRGARLDGWSEHYDLQTWQEAALALEIDLEGYLRQRDFSETLPWQHLDPGLAPEFLRDELAKALAEEYTPDCRVNGCQQCGICDFKTVQPVVFEAPDEKVAETALPAGQNTAGRAGGEERQIEQRHFIYRLNYSRVDKIRFLGHLELIQVFFQAFRRVKMPLNFSQGFNPSPRVAFSPALPLGTESVAEYLDADLCEPLSNPDVFLAALNEQLPDGLTINTIALKEKGREKNGAILTCYLITLPTSLAGAAIAVDIDRFLASREHLVVRERKGRKREMDIRPQVRELVMERDGRIRVVMESEVGRAGVKPLELLEEIIQSPAWKKPEARIMKTWWRPA